MPTHARIEELLLLLNDIHVRLEMLKDVLDDYKDIDCDWILDEIKIQELVILAKLAELGVNSK
jgi:hypothetical protein